MKKELLELRVNKRSYELAVEPSRILLDVLRQDLDLTGSKRGCDDSSCGACTIQVDGVPMLSCTMLAASCEGQEITTVEGLADHGSLAALQKAYGDFGGAQCGFCTPGFMMTVKALLVANPDPTEDEIREAMRRLSANPKTLAEPSGAVAPAAFLFHASELPATNVNVAVISGGNIDPALLANLRRI